MAYRFALAPLLRLRASVEQQCRRRLQDATLRSASATARVGQLQDFLARSAVEDADAARSGRTAAEMQFALRVREQLHRYREQLVAEARRLEAERQQAGTAYHSAKRQTEVLESLQTSGLRNYRKEQERREQRELDATHLVQRWHARKSSG